MPAAATPEIDSIGYEGAALHQVVSALDDAGVELLVDVRIRPQSRKPGLSKTPLSAELASAGIGYEHLRDLGTPLDIRADFRGGELERGRARFRAYLDEDEAAALALERLVELAGGRRTAVLCFERDERTCHRLVVLEELERRGLARPGRHLHP